MISVSTAWRSSKIRNGAHLIDTMAEAGIEAVELEYRITSEMFEQMKPRLDVGQVAVTSIHNFFPVPDGAEPERGSGDLFSCASDDEEERRLAIEHGIRSIKAAARVRAKYVVLHLSKVPMRAGTQELKRFFDKGAIDSGEARRFRTEFVAERRERAPRAFERVLSSLDMLLHSAEKYGVTIGVENRYHPNEIPDADEIGAILEAFEGAPVGYWHDVGHAVVQERLGMCRQARLLESFADRMVGIHIHDVIGYDDHWAPGTGEVDYTSIAPYVPAGVAKVVEVHSKVGRDELVSSLDYIRGMGFD